MTRSQKIMVGVAAIVAVGLTAAALYDQVGRDVVETQGYKPLPLSSMGKKDILIINAHEHMLGRRVAWRMLKAMDDLGITKTVICAGSTMTTKGVKKVGFLGYDENNEEMLQTARKWPDRFIPFITLNPTDTDNVERLKRWFKKGAKGVKLYSGHGDFHHLAVGDEKFLDVALDDPNMMPAYEWMAAHHVPLLWHVNTRKYLDEFRRVLDEIPGLNINCPHHCMSTTDTTVFVQILRDYPTVYADLSHGFHSFMADALRRVATHPKEFRAAYDEFPDRFFWGSDTVVTPHSKKGPEWIKGMMVAYFGLFGEAEFSLPVYDNNYNRQADEKHPGLKLPPDMLKRFYQTNAERWLGVEAGDTVPTRQGWPKWVADPKKLGLGEVVEQANWEGLYAAANRLTCEEGAPEEARRESADALRAVLTDERVPARVAMRLAMGVPGLVCLDEAEVAREEDRRAGALRGEFAQALREQAAAGRFVEMAVTLGEMQSLKVKLSASDTQPLLETAVVAVDQAGLEKRFGDVHRALLVATALDRNAPGLEDKRKELAPHLAVPAIRTRQATYSDVPGGIALAVAGARVDGDGILLDLGVRNKTEAAIELRANDFVVQASGGARGRGEPAAKDALGGSLAAGNKVRGHVRFSVTKDAPSYVLLWKGGDVAAGKSFVLKAE